MKFSIPSAADKLVRVTLDATLNSWRALVLYGRPGYYINNIVGNSVFLRLQGGKLSHVIRQMDRRYVRDIRKVTDDLRAPRQVEGGLHHQLLQRATHLGDAEELALGRGIVRAKQSVPGRAGHYALDKAQRLNSIFEDSARRESFLAAAEKDLAKRGVRLVGTNSSATRSASVRSTSAASTTPRRLSGGSTA